MPTLWRFWTGALMREYTNSQIEALIDDHVHSQRDRDILKRRLIDGVVYDRLADEFGLSVQRVKAIVYRNQDRLFKYI